MEKPLPFEAIRNRLAAADFLFRVAAGSRRRSNRFAVHNPPDSMKTLLLLVSALALVAGPALADPVNKLCPVRADKAGNPAKTARYSKSVAFCSATCKVKFDKAPGSFGKEIAAHKEDGGKCALCAKPAAAGQRSNYQCEVTFCCDRCKGRFESEPDKFIEKALKK
jgi:YHS domain-containing protein